MTIGQEAGRGPGRNRAGGPDAALAAALAALEQGRPADAAAYLRERLRHLPVDPTATELLGVALFLCGDAAGALGALERAHYLAPEEPRFLYNYGLALEAAGRPQEALLRFDAALLLDPEYEPALRERLLAGPPERPPREPAPEPTLRQREAPLPGGGAPASPGAGEIPAAAPELELLPPPGIPALARAAAEAWLRHLVLWLALAGLPLAGAALAFPPREHPGAAAVLVWALALGLGTAAACAGAAGALLDGRPFSPGVVPSARAPGLLALHVPYWLLTVGGMAWLLAGRTPLTTPELLLAGHVFTVPFHTVAAPALMLAVTEGGSPLALLLAGLRITRRRALLHLVLLAAAALLGAGCYAAVMALAAGWLVSAGPQGQALLQVAVLAVCAGGWSILLAACGLDTLALAPPRADREARTGRNR